METMTMAKRSMLQQVTRCLVLLAAASAMTFARASDPPDVMEDHAQNQARGSTAAVLEQMLRQSMPTEKHAKLRAIEGRWNVRSTFTLGAGMEELKATGTAEGIAILDGRFVRLTSRMDFQGLASEAITEFGFDTRHQQYTVHAIDSLGTYAVDAAGEPEDAGKVLRLRGKLFEPSPKPDDPGKTYSFEMVYTFQSADQWMQVIRMQLQTTEWITVSTLVYERAAPLPQPGSDRAIPDQSKPARPEADGQK